MPAHTYQFTFCENTQWSKFYAPGAEIKTYIDRVAREFDVHSLVKLQHEVTEMRWDGNAGKWSVSVKNLATGESFVDVADFIANAPGGLSRPVWPKIPGREKYRGIVHHSGDWDIASEEANGVDYKGKRVAVIGIGSSGIQIVPAMRERGAKVTNFGRTKSEFHTNGICADSSVALGSVCRRRIGEDWRQGQRQHEP
ncbi:MAG: NAD(P)/FAD-dependent oxidoreductase [Nitrospira sp.]|nr:NAD(P)/FAD-dependent oxidoreductase [Nitrospira sp.]